MFLLLLLRRLLTATCCCRQPHISAADRVADSETSTSPSSRDWRSGIVLICQSRWPAWHQIRQSLPCCGSRPCQPGAPFMLLLKPALGFNPWVESEPGLGWVKARIMALVDGQVFSRALLLLHCTHSVLANTQMMISHLSASLHGSTL